MRAVLVLAVLLAVGGGVGGPSAVAAPSPGTASVSASLPAGRVSPNNSGGGGGSTITCTLQAQYPHTSTHVPGTINAVATNGCSGFVTTIKLQSALYYGSTGNLAAFGPLVTVTGGAAAQSNVSISCITGSFFQKAFTTVTWPPGYSPSPQSWTATSATVDILKCP